MSSQISLNHGQFQDMTLMNQVDLTICDPPDNQRMKYHNYDDNLPRVEYILLLKKWIIKACKITNGPVFFSFAEQWIPYVEHIISANNILLVQRLYWHYTFGQNNKKRYSPCMRPIYWLNDNTIYPDAIKIPSARQTKYKDKRAKSGGKMPSNIWEFPRVCGTFKEKRKWHCTQHPEALIKRIIAGHSLPGDTVLSPFIGSGTDAYVCYELNRNCIGIDISKFYIDKIKEEFLNRYGITI
jgi:site-specific DNA-methyltransferase (adenine-specific)